MSPSDLKDLIANADALLAWAEGRLEWTRPETKVAVRHVRDAAYWKRPVGTIIIAEGLFNKLSNLKQVVTEHPSIAGSLVVTDNKGRKFDVFKHDDKKWYAATHEPNPNKWGRDVIPGQKSQEDAFLALDKKVGGGKTPGEGKPPHEPGTGKTAHVSNADKATKLAAGRRRASAAGERARKAERAKAKARTEAGRPATVAERKEANKHGAIPTGRITKDEPAQQRIRNSDGTTRLVDVGSDSHSKAVANLASFKPDDTRTTEENRQIAFYGDSKKGIKPKAGIVTLPSEEHKAVVTFISKLEKDTYEQAAHHVDWSDTDFWKQYSTPKTSSPAVNAAIRNVVKMGRVHIRKQRKEIEVTRPGAPMRVGNRHSEAATKAKGDFRRAMDDVQQLIGEKTRLEKLNEDRAPMPKPRVRKAPSTGKPKSSRKKAGGSIAYSTRTGPTAFKNAKFKQADGTPISSADMAEMSNYWGSLENMASNQSGEGGGNPKGRFMDYINEFLGHLSISDDEKNRMWKVAEPTIMAVYKKHGNVWGYLDPNGKVVVTKAKPVTRSAKRAAARPTVRKPRPRVKPLTRRRSRV